MKHKQEPLSLAVIGHDLGLLMQIPGVMALVSLLVVIGSEEWFTLPGFLITVLLGLGGGQLLYRCCPEVGASSPAQPMIVVAFGWLLIVLVSGFPFYLAAHFGHNLSETTRAFGHPLNALFESMSGFTSTGLTMTRDPSALPISLQWWRSVTEWVGGVGVIVLALALIEPSEDNYALYSAETRSSQLGDSIKESARRIWGLFVGYTIFAIGLFYLVGVPWWESINHGMTGIATGGFTITSHSFGAHDVFVKSSAILIMLLGSISFPIHHALLYRGDLQCIMRQSQWHTFLVLFVCGLGLLTTTQLVGNAQESFIDQLFQWTSAFGTCGFSSANLALWSQPGLFILMIGMFIGGMAGSTTGGLKVSRVAWLGKAIMWRLQSFWIKDEVQYVYDGKKVEKAVAMSRVSSAALLACLYILTLLTGTLILFVVLGDQFNLHEIFFEATSALGSVGLSVGITSPDLPGLAKITLMLLMWMGRLEILAVLVLILSPFLRVFRRR